MAGIRFYLESDCPLDLNPIREISFVKVESELITMKPVTNAPTNLETAPIPTKSISKSNGLNKKSDSDHKNDGKIEMKRKVKTLTQKIRRQLKRINKLKSLLETSSVSSRVRPPLMPSKMNYRSLKWIEAISTIQSNIEDTCRLCIAPLKTRKRKKSLFNKPESPIIFNELNISSNDGLPQQICRNCLSFLKEFKIFHRQAIRSQDILKQHFRTVNIGLEMNRLIDNPNLLDNQTEYNETVSKDDVQCQETNRCTEKEEELIEKPGSDDVLDILPAVNDDSATVEINSPISTNDVSDMEDNTNVEITVVDPALQCTICCAVFRQQAHIKQHMAMHDGLTYECDICGHSYGRKTYLARHMQNHSTTTQTCPLCKATFTNPYRYKYHLKTHNPNKKYKCQYCEKSFLQAHHWKQHEDTHTGAKPYLCFVCGQAFRTYTDYTSHLEKHSGGSGKKKYKYKPKTAPKKVGTVATEPLVNKMYKCDMCDKQFTSKALYLHKRTHSKPFPCNMCNNRFGKKVQLYLHINRKHNGNGNEVNERDGRDEEERNHVCTVCDSAFKRLAHLKSHIRFVHLKEKPFECTVCGNRFSMRGTLAEHMATHSDERPFACNFCSSKFRTKRTLQSHMITHRDSMDI